MKTRRNDVITNRRQSLCFNSISTGYSTYKLRKGDLFLYTEHYSDGTTCPRLGKCHGQIRPIEYLEEDTRPYKDYYILTQTASSNTQFSYERWIDPNDVVEIIPAAHANKHILAFFEDTEKNS